MSENSIIVASVFISSETISTAHIQLELLLASFICCEDSLDWKTYILKGICSCRKGTISVNMA